MHLLPTPHLYPTIIAVQIHIHKSIYVLSNVVLSLLMIIAAMNCILVPIVTDENDQGSNAPLYQLKIVNTIKTTLYSKSQPNLNHSSTRYDAISY